MSNTRAILEKALGTAALVGTKDLLGVLERMAGVDTLAALRALQIDDLMVKHGSSVEVRGSAVEFDRMPRRYEFNPLSVAADDGSAVIAPVPAKGAGRWELRVIAPNTQADTTYTLVSEDAAGGVRTTNASAVAITMPTNAVVPQPIGTIIPIIQGGAGRVTVSGAGVTFTSRTGLFATAAEGSKIFLQKVATDEWLVTGGLLIPSFFYVLNTTQTNKTGNGTDYKLIYNQNYRNDGGLFNGAATMTALVDGLYKLEAHITVSGITAAADSISVYFDFPGSRNLVKKDIIANAIGQQRAPLLTGEFYLNAGETVETHLIIEGEAGAVCDVLGTGSHNLTWITGRLLL